MWSENPSIRKHPADFQVFCPTDKKVKIQIFFSSAELPGFGPFHSFGSLIVIKSLVQYVSRSDESDSRWFECEHPSDSPLSSETLRSELWEVRSSPPSHWVNDRQKERACPPLCVHLSHPRPPPSLSWDHLLLLLEDKTVENDGHRWRNIRVFYTELCSNTDRGDQIFSYLAHLCILPMQASEQSQSPLH